MNLFDPEVIHPRALRESLISVVAPIMDRERAPLRQRAEQLKQTNAEGWAIGEMLERACILLDALEYGLARAEKDLTKI